MFVRHIVAVVIIAHVAAYCLSGTTNELDIRRTAVESANLKLKEQIELERIYGTADICKPGTTGGESWRGETGKEINGDARRLNARGRPSRCR